MFSIRSNDIVVMILANDYLDAASRFLKAACSELKIVKQLTPLSTDEQPIQIQNGHILYVRKIHVVA